jgi:endonuclease-8
MPEGDTVYLTARRLNAALAGHRLRRGELRHPRWVTHDLSGRTVLAVRSVGKHLFTRFDAGLSLHSHLRMDGSWHLYRPADRWRGANHDVRAVLATEERVAVGFRLHDLELLATDDERRLVGHLGPDLLDLDWSEALHAEATRRLTADPAAEVGLALLDQRVMAGVGNLYRAEVCFLLRVSPWSPVELSRRPGAGGHAGAHAAAAQRRPAGAVHHRGARPRPPALGLPACRPAVPPLWHPDPDRRAGRRRLRPHRVLLPALPTRHTPAPIAAG